jgi:4-hydroxy-tetrahydrodipicolinate reductase
MGRVFSGVALRHADIEIVAGLDINVGSVAVAGSVTGSGSEAAGAGTGASVTGTGGGNETAGAANGTAGGDSRIAGGAAWTGCNGGTAYPVYDAAGGMGAGAGSGASAAGAPPALAEPYDVILDFSHPSALSAILGRALSKSTPIVLAATGYTERQADEILDASRRIPIFRSANMSLGVNLMTELAKRAAGAIGGSFDIEIIEKHHRRKVDAPSGTALMIADAVNGELGGGMDYAYDRHAERKARSGSEIGIHTVRGGTIVGEHAVIFAGNDEILEIRHVASSKEVFAEGAIRAIRFMADPARRPGLYGMGDALARHSNNPEITTRHAAIAKRHGISGI